MQLATRLASRHLSRAGASPLAGKLLALMLSLSVTACAPAMRGGSAAGPVASPILRIHDTKSGRNIPFQQFANAIAGADMVFVGEMHDDPATHALELAILAALGERRQNVVLSLEMFERDVQQQLDAYLAGHITEKAFLANARPWDRYTTDYRGMVELARVRGWPVVASNIPRRLASAVSRQTLAFFDTIPAADRPFIASENQCPRDSYYEKFAAVMGGGASHGSAAPVDTAAARATLDRYYQAQCVKDEAMGESIAKALQKAGPGAMLVHINGAFHSDYHLGTVERAVRRRPGAKAIVVTSVPVADPATGNPAEHAGKADYLVFTRVTK